MSQDGKDEKDIDPNNNAKNQKHHLTDDPQDNKKQPPENKIPPENTTKDQPEEEVKLKGKPVKENKQYAINMSEEDEKKIEVNKPDEQGKHEAKHVGDYLRNIFTENIGKFLLSFISILVSTSTLLNVPREVAIYLNIVLAVILSVNAVYSTLT